MRLRVLHKRQAPGSPSLLCWWTWLQFLSSSIGQAKPFIVIPQLGQLLLILCYRTPRPCNSGTFTGTPALTLKQLSCSTHWISSLPYTQADLRVNLQSSFSFGQSCHIFYSTVLMLMWATKKSPLHSPKQEAGLTFRSFTSF